MAARLAFSRPAMSVAVFGTYLLTLGAVLIIAPNLLLGLFRMAPTTEVWIRIVGMLVLFLGTYYVLAALSEVRAFFRWTVPIRFCVLVFFGGFVLSGYAPAVLLVFGVADVAGACWTAWTLRATPAD
jgi:hypothetical protein